MSIFPFISPESYSDGSQTAQELPLFAEYAYDFKKNALRLKNGKTYLVYGNEALQIWIYKALKTQRFQFIGYTRAYGNEAETLYGMAMNQDIFKSELRRFIIEALMVNPYIVELSNFTFEFEGSKVTVNFDCTTIYGEMRQQYTQERG